MSKDNLYIGVVQGRLIQSPPGQLQWFPQDDWQSEFFLCAALRMNYIEFIAERNHNASNPLWTDEGVARIKSLARRNGLALTTFCNDYVIDHALTKDKEVLKQNLDLIERGALLGCTKYVLPMFERSELNLDNSDDFVGPLRLIADRAARSSMTVCLETVLKAADLLKVLDSINHPAVSVVYDTGNRVAFGHDLPGDIKMLAQRISHVHIKDKNAVNENVILGTGLVNFLDVFKALADIRYQGAYTFETQRGNDPLRTAKYNMDLVHYFHGEAFSP